MVRPQGVIDGILHTLKQSDSLPSSITYVGYEPDIESEAIKLPMIEVSTGIMEDLDVMNTSLIGPKLDESGNEVGRIYQSNYAIELDVAVWTAHGSKYSPRELSNVVRDELYKHTTGGPDKPLRNTDGSPIDEVWNVSLLDAEQNDDLATTPTLRRWTQTISIVASEEYITDGEDPIAAINARLEYDDANDSFEDSFTIQ